MFNSAADAEVYDYKISYSLKFNGTSHALDKTFGTSATNDDAKAISVWIKRSGDAGTNSEFGSTTNTKLCSSDDFNQLEFNTGNPSGFSDQFGYYINGANNAAWYKSKWRDPSAWSHIVWIYNSDESTTTDRVKVYFNGEAQPIGDSDLWNYTNSDVNPYPPSGTDCQFGLNTKEMHIARYEYDDGGWWGGQMADFIMIDGTASISDFGETHNGVWRPKDPSGLTFGNNGFWLKFSNTSDFGEDFSGNNNDFTVRGSIPATNRLLDSPTNNFCTWNPVDMKNASLTGGNLDAEDDGTNYNQVRGTHSIGTSGKWYMELYKVNCGSTYAAWGVCDQNQKLTASYTSPGYVGKAMVGAVWDFNQTDVYLSTTYSESSAGSDLGDTADVYTNTAQVIGMAIDLDNDKIFTHVDGTWDTACGDPDSSGSGFNASGLNDIKNLVPVVFPNSTNTPAYTLFLNCGQDSSFGGNKTSGSANGTDANGLGDFYYDPPSGYKAICSQNLSVNANVDAAQTSDNYPEKLFSSILWTGDGSTKAITGLGFKPDWVWIKERENSSTYGSYDSSRGNTNVLGMANTTAADYDQTADPGLETFGTDGFTVDYPNTGDYYINRNTETYVAWNWRANGGTTSSNDNGSITSTVQVDPSGHFSIVTYTGESATRTVGHGLSAAPDYIIVKSRENTRNWAVYYGDNTDAMQLNNGNATDDGNYWADTSPTSTVFTVGDSNETGKSEDYVAYCFANCEGYIQSGSYTGNANADGTFVYLGFRPAWLMVKYTGSGESWVIVDNKRNGTNPTNKNLRANNEYAEASGSTYDVDLLSNGFKPRTTWEGWNGSGYTITYLAFAESPFKYATAR